MIACVDRPNDQCSICGLRTGSSGVTAALYVDVQEEIDLSGEKSTKSLIESGSLTDDDTNCMPGPVSAKHATFGKKDRL